MTVMLLVMPRRFQLCFVVWCLMAAGYFGQHCKKVYSRYICTCNSTAFLDYSRAVNFDQIPDEVMDLSFTSAQQGIWPYNRGDLLHCNILRHEHTSIPFTRSLTKLYLTGFTGERHQRPSFKQFVKNVQSVIESLTINFCKIGYLDSHFFGNFRKLVYIDLSKNDIYDVSIDTFQNMELTSSSGWLDLSENALQEVDFRVFESLESWMDGLDLDKQYPKLRKLYLSGSNFELAALKQVFLVENDSSSMPVEILQSSPQLQGLALQENKLCDTDDCSCCETQRHVAVE
ncbi:uncharacterized protein LOC129590689 isoform X2 [Paramacrobiotus metropolitanus]|uniref:uncharacterized protein LOC129590689 isoform X2 n=1 Tax=Paramacrobiotus metropolitanus TaxID=2943436 RepID=UPI002445DBE2|nr:uncharacterized protein LOC129590689 isoform X2 [Paramacrobiotus metropolitanus]